MPLKDFPSDARPREKLLARGPQALGDSELLALLLRTGMAGKSVLHLAQELLDHFGGIAGLLNASLEDLKSTKGMGDPAKRPELVAVLDLARRALALVDVRLLDHVIVAPGRSLSMVARGLL